MNHFLKPIVDELLQLWSGISLSITYDGVTVNSHSVRAALLCFISDIPATRKVCGFPALKATLGCSKCLKAFPCIGFGEPTNYSGFDRQSWIQRTKKDHIESVRKVQAATTVTEKKQLQKKYGVQYSELCRLPYFDVVRNHVIDPMHNMYLGTAKHMIKVWRDKCLLQQDHLFIIQKRIDEMNVPFGVGRIPYKIGSNFSGLTADQWLNWTNLYSLYALHDILPPIHIRCWSLFVEASILLHQYIVSVRDVTIADEKILQFCQMFEELYGEEKCTPNMHLHTHIKECILDYGPFSAFWAFPFERFNGVLESFSKNWVKPEEQIMHKLISYQELMTMKITAPDFSSLAELCLHDNLSGSLQHMQADAHILKCYRENATCELCSINASFLHIHHILSQKFEKYFSDFEVKHLEAAYSLLYPSSTFSYIPKKHIIFYDLKVFGEHFLSSRSRSARSSVVMAYWGEIGHSIKVGSIDYFFLHTITFNSDKESSGEKQENLFAKVKWYSDHFQPRYLPHPLYLVSTVPCIENCFSYIPVSRILCRCGISPETTFNFDYGNDTAFVICPYFLRNAISYSPT